MQISLGKTFSLFLTERSEIYSQGTNQFGELGLGTPLIKAAIKPAKLQEFMNKLKQNKEFIVQISSGKYHSVALSNEGNIYTWGKNTGNPANMEFSEIPLLNVLDKNHAFSPYKV